MAARVKATVDKDTRVTIQEIVNTLDITSGSVLEVLKHHHGYRKVCDRRVPQILTPANKKV